MIPLFRRFFCAALIVSLAVTHFASAANDQNFDAVALSNDTGSNTFVAGTFTFIKNGPGNIGIFNNAGPSVFLSTTGADHFLVFDGPGSLGVTQTEFRTTDGTEFQLVGFAIDTGFGLTAYTITGYRDGASVNSATLNLSSSTSNGGATYTQLGGSAGQGTLSFSGWDNIDRVVFTSGDLDTMLDDIDVGPAVLPAPTITSATYDAATGVLAVTGANMTTGDTIAVNKLTLTGEGGSTYLLTTANVTASSATAFSVTLNATDRAAVNQILNKNGTSSTNSTTYNLSAADDWDANVTAGNTADATNSVTVSNVATPTISSATYDASTGTLVVTGTGFLKLSGSPNDIDVSKLSISGDSTGYTLTSASVEITSGTNFTVVLNGTDISALLSRINQNGTSSIGAVTYNLAAAEDWAAGAAAAVAVADLTGNGITASNVTNPPAVGTTGGTTAFTEGNNVTSTPVIIDSGLTVSDFDSLTLASGTVSITVNFQSGQDVLSFTNDGSTMGNISGIYNAGTGVLALTSAGTTATLAQWQAALRSITYTNTSNTPNTSTRTTSFAVSDGALTSSAATKAVSVAATNDAPIVTPSGGTTSFTEPNNSSPSPVVIDATITVSDLDNATFASATVSITGNFQSGEDVLGFTNNPGTMGNIIGSYSAGTGILTLTSAGATASTAQWQAALQAATFVPNVQTPSTATRTISFVVNDGTTSSSAGTKSVTVALVNDSPVGTTTGGTTAFTEGNNATSTPVIIDSGFTASDEDSATLSTATVAITVNFQAGQDVLAFANDGSTMGNIVGSYNAGNSILTLSSASATATIAEWQAAFRSITYTNTSNSPNTSTRTISFFLNDGNSVSSASTKSVSVAAVNDSPIATASGGPTTFTEGNNVTSTPVAVDGSVTVSDVDSAMLASATVSITVNFQSGEDTLAFTNNGSTMGNIIGSYNAGTGVLTLTSAGATATIVQWQAALQTVTYTNSSDTPNTSTRTLSFAVNDGSTASSASTKSVSVAATNDAPINTVPGTQTTNEETNKAITGLSIADSDAGGAGMSVTLGITNGTLTVTGGTAAISNSGTTSVGLTGTIVQINATLASNVTYVPSVDFDSTATLTVTTSDNGNTGGGGTHTDIDPVSITVTATNDTPIVTTSGGPTAFTEGNNVTSTPVVIDAGLTVADVDSAMLASATVSITANFQSGQDVLGFTNDGSTMGNISGSYNAGTGVLTLTSAGATATLAHWQAALHAVTYTNSSNAPATASRTISFAVNDGSTASTAATKTVSVASTNDDPTNILLSSSTVNQAAGLNAVVGTLSSTDVDSVSFTYSLVSGTGSTDNASFNISGATLQATDPSLLAEGNYSVRIRTTDSLSATFDKIFSIAVVDNASPAAPSTPDLAAVSDSGTSSTDNLTNITTPTFTGTAEANSTVELFRGGVTSLGTTTADGSGNWSLTLGMGAALTTGTYSITAQATDAGSNTSVASSGLSITIDLTAPAGTALVGITNDTGTSSTDEITSDATLILSGTAEAASVVTVTQVGVGVIGTAVTSGGGNWSFDYTATTLAMGDHVFRASATDAAGNSSSASADFLVTIDAGGPAQVAISAISTDSGSSSTDGITNDQTLTLSGTAEAASTVTLNRTGIGALGTTVANGSGAWSFNYTGTTLAEGDYLFTATSVDLAGNTSVVSASFPVTVDLTAPVAPAITGVADDTGTSATDQITSDGTLIISGTTEALSTITITRFGLGVIGTATADSAGEWSFDYTATTLSVGSYIFTAAATDPAGNVSPASSNFSVTVENAPAFTTQPVGGSYMIGDTITLSVTPSGAGPFTYQWYLDGSALTDTAQRTGSTSDTLVLTTVPISFAGLYTVVVTNLPGSVTSAPVAVAIDQLTQTITFAQPATPTAGTPLTLTASASSGLTITFSVVSGAATIVNGNQLLAGDGGAITIRASQVGDATYGAALDIDRLVTAAVAAPQITVQPIGGTVIEGGTFTLSAGGAGVRLSYQWMRNGVDLPGETQATLVLAGAMQSQQGTYTVTISNVTGSVVSAPVEVTVQPDNRVFNLSSRLRAGTGSRTFISGFIIRDGTKSVVIRGVGPGLAQFGLTSTLGNPTLKLHNRGGVVAEAGAWGNQSNVLELTAAMQHVGAFALTATDSAMLVSLQPGDYTATISGTNGETGVSLVEIYDASPASGRLINISTRGEVGRGADVLIAGFIISGATPKRFLIRAVGPGLTVYGVDGILVNPALRLFNAAGTTLGDNDDWQETDGGAAVTAATIATGAFPLVAGAKDSAMAVTLPPGAYTAHGYGKDNGTGVALVEVYEVP